MKKWAPLAVAGMSVIGLSGIMAVALSDGNGSGASVAMVDANNGTSQADSTSTDSTSAATTVPTTTTTLPPRAQPGLLPATGSGPLDGLIIVVDPGHNGRNFLYSDVTRAGVPHLCNTTGATSSSGTPEVEINWAIGIELSEALTASGATVLLTHEDNDGFGPCADERGAMAKEHDAAAFVSLHADGSSSGGSGFHVIHPAVHPRLSKRTVSESLLLANALRNELVWVGGRTANYVGTGGVQERGDLANLNTADTPSVLIEMGNLRNPVDGVMLEEKGSQRVIAAAIARGLLRYLGKPADLPAVNGDLNGDGWADLLPDYTTTTTTTSTTTTSTTTTSTTTTTTVPAPPTSTSTSTTTTTTAATGRAGGG